MPCPSSRFALFLALSVWSGATGPAPIPLDERHQAHTFEGIGALSAGASSRLLWDYDEAAREQILDLLFKPNYGASLQILKVEIGGDTQSTDGSEASHEHEQGDLDCSRGYELWLLKEAKRRNPEILAYGLSWGLPGWVGNETYFSADNVKYQVDWAKCMREEAGVDLNYLGIWNERPWGNTDYTLELRSALDGAGFRATELVMLDGGASGSFSEAMDANASFRSAFGAVGLHYPCNTPLPDVLRHGKRLWASEEASVPATWGGAGCWGRVLNQNYVRMNMTASIMWSLVWSAYPNLDCFGNGLLYAFQPWSGGFSVNAPVWVTAHTTQFVGPGWRYLRPGSGLLPEGGTFVSMVDGLGNVTLILETLLGSCMYHSGCPHDLRPSRLQHLAFRLDGALRSARRLALWLTNRTHHFLRLADVEVDENGLFEVEMPLDTVITLTSPGNSNRQSKANGDDLPPPSESGKTSPFPLPYSESFGGYPGSLTGSIVKYFADQSGAWEASGGVLRQVVTRPPGRNQWSCNSDPFTQVGDVNWTSYSTSVRARLPEEAEGGAAGAAYVALCVRVVRYAGFKCGAVPGHCLRLNRSGWILVSAGPDAAEAGRANVLASGREVALNGSKWSKLELRAFGSLIEASVDGKTLVYARSTASFVGQVALGSGWHRAEFDDLAVQGLPPAPAPAPGSTALKRLSVWTRDWGGLTCNPAPRTAGRGPRSDYSGYVGMRLRVRRPVTLTALGRWRSDGDVRSHALVLAGESGVRVRADLKPEVRPDNTGMAWAEVAEVVLQPGVYDVLTEESVGGDQWLDEGVLLEEEDWAEVLASVYGPSPEALQTSSPHTAYGPVSLRIGSGGAALRSLGAASDVPVAQAASSLLLSSRAPPAWLLVVLLAGAPLAWSRGRVFRRS